jgi:hypothetical protein
LTSSLPVPIAPQILRTENTSSGGRVVIAPSVSATKYHVEVSADNGATWTPHTTDGSAQPLLTGLQNGKKVHVRAIASNAQHASVPGLEYPLYVTNQPPPVPDGLLVELGKGFATITWGEVLGARTYALYGRLRGAKDFQLLTRTATRLYVDHRATIQPCNESPGGTAEPNADGIWEYAVAAANDNVESRMSRIVNSDPASWLNWNPRPGEPFRRVYSYPNDVPQPPGQKPRYDPD